MLMCVSCSWFATEAKFERKYMIFGPVVVCFLCFFIVENYFLHKKIKIYDDVIRVLKRRKKKNK